MDGSQFDAISRAVTRAGSRRRALTGALAGALGLLQGVDERAAAKKKKKPCPPCKKRKKGKCKANLPDGTGCSGGTCQGGSCVATTAPPPPFCASQPDGAPCGYCRRCQGGVCQADTAQNEGSCGSDGTGRCWEGTCNPVPSCVARNGPCQTVADCCSAGSTNVPTTCAVVSAAGQTCNGRSDTGQPCHHGTHCWSGANCVAYVCR